MRFKTVHGVYVFGEGDARMFIALCVDDLLMMWKQREVLEMVKRLLQERFEMKDLGRATFLLGIEFKETRWGGSLACATKVCFRGYEEIGLS